MLEIPSKISLSTLIGVIPVAIVLDKTNNNNKVMVCIILNSDFTPNDKAIPLVMNSDNLLRLVFEHWFNKYIEPYKIMIITYKHFNVLRYLTDIFGMSFYREFFSPDYRDLYTMATVINDIYDFRNGKPLFNRIDVQGLARTLGVKNLYNYKPQFSNINLAIKSKRKELSIRNRDPMYRALLIAKIYKMLISKLLMPIIDANSHLRPRIKWDI